MQQTGDPIWDEPAPATPDYEESKWSTHTARYSNKAFNFKKAKYRRKMAKISRRKNRR